MPEVMPDGSPWPRVSVVTPSYNQGRFIEETIRSVLLQGYPNLEYFIIDGGSSDESVEVIRKYEPWLTYWVSEKDRGQSHAINKGWERATGEYVAWQNSDDIYVPHTLEMLVNAGRSDTDAGVIYGRSEIIDEDSRLTGTVKGKPYDIVQVLAVTSSTPIPQPAAFIRRIALEQAGPLDDHLQHIMDTDIWLRLGLLGFRIVYVAEIWSRHRKHPAQSSAQRTPRGGEERLRVLNKVYGTKRVLPPAVIRVRRTAYAWAYYRRGFWLLLEGSWRKGIVDLARCVAYDPFVLLRRRILRRCLLQTLRLVGIK